MTSWMTGNCCTIREENDEKRRQHILDYMIVLMDDINDFSPGVAKASFTLQNRPREIIDYSQTEKN